MLVIDIAGGGREMTVQNMLKELGVGVYVCLVYIFWEEVRE